MTRALDLVGKSFNRWTVEDRLPNTTKGQTVFRCLCICGNRSEVLGSSLKNGKSKSCGCFAIEKIGSLNRTHGHTNSRTYNSWRGMRERCDNPKNKRYDRYGAVGISYSADWVDFEVFLRDMGVRPEGKTLERIDCTKSYSVINCKWDNLTNQAFNIGLKSNNTSGRSGVSLHRDGVRYVAKITHNKKVEYLGLFHCFKSAVKAREAKELEYYGFIKK